MPFTIVSLVLLSLCLSPAPASYASTNATNDGDSPISAARHVFVQDSGCCTSIDARQRWRTHVDERGFTIVPQHAEWTWGLDLRGYGWGDDVMRVGEPLSTTATGVRCEREWDARLTEWYINDERGLEHGFTLATRPPDTRGSLRLEITTRGGLVPVVQGSGDAIAFCDADGVARLHYTGLVVFDANGDRFDAHFVADEDGLVLHVDDAAADYPLTIDPLAQSAYVKASNTDAFDFFGWSIDMDGNTLVVGAWGERSAATGIDGDQSDNSAEEAGAVYVFVRSGASWVQQAYLKASNTGGGDSFGRAVAISGDTIVVGALGEDSAATGVNGAQGDQLILLSGSYGAAYVFVRTGGVWTQEAYLKASNTDWQDQFGSAVDIDGDTVVIGAPVEDSGAVGVGGDQLDNNTPSAGAVYVFTRTGTSWAQTEFLKASNTGVGDGFGSALALCGNTLVVGAPNEDSRAVGINGAQADNGGPNAGAVYIFERSGSAWSQQAYVKASNTGAGDLFGQALALDGDTLAVSALGDDSADVGVDGDQSDSGGSNTFDAGAVHVFTRTGSIWSQQAYLKASNTEALDTFGSALAIEGDVLVVGATREDSVSFGVGGDQNNNLLLDSGAAYVFERQGTHWAQVSYVKATFSDQLNVFGSALAIEGGTVVVSANGESSNATGIDQVPTGNALFSGAVYVFEPTHWDLVRGCLTNPATFVEPTLPPSIGTEVEVSLFGGAVTDGTAFIYFGVNGIDRFGCGTLLSPTAELLLAVAPFPALLAGVPVSGGSALVPVLVPNNAALVGVEVTLQAMLFDPLFGVLELSNGIEFEIQG